MAPGGLDRGSPNGLLKRSLPNMPPTCLSAICPRSRIAWTAAHSEWDITQPHSFSSPLKQAHREEVPTT